MKTTVIAFGFDNFHKVTVAGKVKTSARCKYCSRTIKDIGTTTTNYRRHLKSIHAEMWVSFHHLHPIAKCVIFLLLNWYISCLVHSSSFRIFLECENQPRTDDVKPTDLHVPIVQPKSSFTQHDKEKALLKSISFDLVVGCGMPISIVENQAFSRFLSVADKNYSSVTRWAVHIYLHWVGTDLLAWISPNSPVLFYVSFSDNPSAISSLKLTMNSKCS